MSDNIDVPPELQQQQPPPIKRDRGMDEEDEDDDDRKTGRERRKIEIKFIADKSRRHITFSKRKAGIMKKAYELSVLTGTQVLLLVVSETGLVYTFTTPKLQPLVTKPEGKNLIQACLNAPEEQSPPGSGQGLGDPTAGPSSDMGLDEGAQLQQGPPPPQQQSPQMRPQGAPPPQAGAGNQGLYMSPEQAAAYNTYLAGMPPQQQQQQPNSRYVQQQHPHMQQQ